MDALFMWSLCIVCMFLDISSELILKSVKNYALNNTINAAKSTELFNKNQLKGVR